MPTLTIDPREQHEISPRLYMQFMEPLGTTDSSVEAGWDALADRWRPDFVAVTRDLAPGAVRWGGILTSFWKWRESVGEPASRPPMVNYLWGGWEKNRVGVDEFLDFCAQVQADPILAINFAADGRPEYIQTALGERRAGDAAEAADLVSYCNDPDSPRANSERAGPALGGQILADRQRNVLPQNRRTVYRRGKCPTLFDLCQGHARARQHDQADRLGRPGARHGNLVDADLD